MEKINNDKSDEEKEYLLFECRERRWPVQIFVTKAGKSFLSCELNDQLSK